MLKKISPDDVTLGMFIHKLEGSWFKHPFWKTRFLLDDPGMLHDLRESGVDAVLIDIAKGKDVAPPTPPTPPAATGGERPVPAARPLADRLRQRAAPAPRPIAATAAADLRSVAPQSLAREFGMATRVAGNAQKVVSRVFLEMRLGKTIRAASIEPVIEDIFASVQRNPHAFNGLMRCKRDSEHVYRHALAVSALMISLGRELKLSADEIREAGTAGLLLDVGVSHLPVDHEALGGDYRAVPDALFATHVPLGHQSLLAAGGFSDEVLSACLAHHERLDGSGYPARLAGPALSTLDRMAAICDTYDTMVADGVHHNGVSPADALTTLAMQPDKFDAVMVKKLVDALGIYPIGTVVRLRTGRMAMVVGQSPTNAEKPVVRAFYSLGERRAVKPEDIDLANCYGADEIEATIDPQAMGLADWPSLREKLFAAGARNSA